MFDHEFIHRALLGGALAGGLCGYVGAWIVLRRMALITDALSHAMFPGLALAAVLLRLSPLGLLLGGGLAALLVAASSEALARTSRLRPDTALGILYPCAYAAGVVVLAVSPVRVHLEHWLFGDIFALADRDLWQLWAVALLLVPALVALQRPLAVAVLGEEFARSIGIRPGAVKMFVTLALVLASCASFHACGVVPTVALLIAPGATLYLLTDRLPLLLWGSAALGAVAAVAGIALSVVLDEVSGGACIALVQGALFLAAFLFAPRTGCLARRRPRAHLCEESFRRWHRPLVTITAPAEPPTREPAAVRSGDSAASAPR